MGTSPNTYIYIPNSSGRTTVQKPEILNLHVWFVNQLTVSTLALLILDATQQFKNFFFCLNPADNRLTLLVHYQCIH